jgi:hypothetical protein
MIANSSVSLGASRRSTDGSKFEIQLESSFEIPSNAVNITVEVDKAVIWYNSPNITTSVNDRFVVYAENSSSIEVKYDVRIPQGLYDVTSLSLSIHRAVLALGYSGSPLITLTGDQSIQKIILTANNSTVRVDFTEANTFRTMIGFNSSTLTATSSTHHFQADNVAKFDVLNYYLIHTDLISHGIRINREFNQTIAQVLIDSSVGSQIRYVPANPIRIEANDLAGSSRTNLRFWLTSDTNEAVNTQGEDWSFHLVIRYLSPILL